jgi:hypothetical protein
MRTDTVKTDLDFAAEVAEIVKYWAEQPQDKRRIAEGVAHSIMAIIDGEGANGQRFVLRPINRGKRGDDIAGRLHNLLMTQL